MMEILLFLFVMLQFFDVYSTYVALTKHNAREANPVIKKLMDSIGILPALGIKLVFTISLGIIMVYFELIEALIISVLVYVWVAYNNYKVIQPKK